MSLKKLSLLVVLIAIAHFAVFAQMNGSAFGAMSRMGGGNKGIGGRGPGKGGDSLQKRDQNADSITIYYKLYNSNEIKKLDSSINDFYKRFPVPYTSYNLGNTGTAAKSYIFSPIVSSGFDAGYHAFDTYNYTLESTPLFQTTRPFTELTYLLGGKGEQLVEIKHTQNRKQQLNFSFEYRFSNSPGNLKNQQANFNNMRITAHFQSKRKRYESFFVMLNNKTASSENGGLVNALLLDSLALNNPYELETRLGQSAASFRNPFNTNISTGSIYQDNSFIWKQSYDLGQKDSVVKDTVTTYLFYPRLRFQNEIKYQTQQYVFQDASANLVKYKNYFDFTPGTELIKYQDSWNKFSNEFSLISYPQKNNSNQYLQVGAAFVNLSSKFTNLSSWTATDIFGFTAYKNKTKNQAWDMDLSGKMFLNGYYAGDYQAKIYLTSLLNKNKDYLQLGFDNSNRTPSINFLGKTSFPLIGLTGIKKENIIQLSAAAGNDKKEWRGAFTYQLINNYQYFATGFQPAVFGKTISYMRGQLQNKFKLSKHWNWYNEMHLQIIDAKAPVNLPLLLTRQRLAYEGVFYKNLNLSTGLELVYHSSFKVDNYMPFTGQFYFQNDYLLANRPSANAFFHMMIKRFKAYVRVENLNTLLPTKATLGNHYNFSSKNYPGTGAWIRVGIWWNFIN
jgi:hypothetical protein